MKLFLRIAFLGTAYSGFQYQNNAPTVQQKLNEACLDLFGVECDVTGCSRTDSGVHANDFCATVSEKGKDSLETAIPTERIPVALGAHLPEDISVMSAEWVPDDFHARYGVKYKEYIYKIWNRRERNPFLSDRAYHYPKVMSADAVEKMNRAAQHFCGQHDFCSYMAAGSKIVSTVRTVMYADVRTDGDTLVFRIAADGFLYNMVRIMMGTLISVGEGKTDPDDIIAITEAKDRARAGMTVSPSGLYLNKVVYR